MCGINGIFSYAASAPAPERTELMRARDAMAARGPDGSGDWASPDGRCLLGHRRLSIIDLLDRARQPMVSADGRYALVFNGEIYNYPALRDAALAAGATLRTTSDTEIILHLYATEGPAMLERLRGMFAIAVWDNAAQSLFVARDPFGIKPFYYSTTGGTFRFASQVGALRAGGGIAGEVDPAAVVGFLMMGSVPEPFTWYRDIAALPAGHSMTIDARGVSAPRPFVDPARILAEAPMVAREAALADAHDAIRDSIQAHLLADVPVGVFLSGGIDSAAILGVASEVSGSPLHAVTLGFDEFAGHPSDEVPMATRIADYYGARHTIRRIGRDEFVADLDDIIATMDQPSIDGINTWFVSKAAREQGLKVAMSGVGADEMLGGYPSFRDVPHWQARHGRLARIPGLGAAAAQVLRTFMPKFVARNPKAAGLLRYTGTTGGAYLLRRAIRLPDDFRGVLDADFVATGLERLDLIDRIDAALDPRPASSHGQVALLELSFYMRNQLLRDADWAGMRHSIEIRTPMVDIALFRRLAPLMPLLRPGEGKQLLAEAPAKPLPDWHRYRPKTGFRVPYDTWMAGIDDPAAASDPANASNGVVARDWSRYVFHRHAIPA